MSTQTQQPNAIDVFRSLWESAVAGGKAFMNPNATNQQAPTQQQQPMPDFSQLFQQPQGQQTMGQMVQNQYPNEPQVGALKSVMKGADGSIKQEFHPPTPPLQTNQQPSGDNQQSNTTNANPSPNTYGVPTQGWGPALMMLGAGLQGQNPAAILQSLIGARGGMQELAGEKPIQPEQMAERKTAIYSAQIGAMKDMQTALNTEAERATNTAKAFLESRNILDKTLGVGKTKQIVGDLQTYQKKITEHLDLINKQILGATANPPKIERNNNQKQSNNVATGKTSSGISWKRVK